MIYYIHRTMKEETDCLTFAFYRHAVVVIIIIIYNTRIIIAREKTSLSTVPILTKLICTSLSHYSEDFTIYIGKL